MCYLFQPHTHTIKSGAISWYRNETWIIVDRFGCEHAIALQWRLTTIFQMLGIFYTTIQSFQLKFQWRVYGCVFMGEWKDERSKKLSSIITHGDAKTNSLYSLINYYCSFGHVAKYFANIYLKKKLIKISQINIGLMLKFVCSWFININPLA